MRKMYKRVSYKASFGLKDSPVQPWVDSVKVKEFDRTHTDPSYYQSTSDQIQTFMQAGKALSDARRPVYDFDDGVDNGAPVPLERTITDAPDISQAFREENDRLLKMQDKSDKAKKERDARIEEQKVVMDVIRDKLPDTAKPGESTE